MAASRRMACGVLVQFQLVMLLHFATSAAATGNAVNRWTGPDADGLFSADGGMVEGCTEEMDVFPEKAKVFLANFAVEYRNTYKIVTNKAAADLKYLLWQRGCKKPTEDQVGGYSQYAGVFEIPLRSVALTSASYFGAMEVMGERTAVRMVDSFQLHSSSPCMLKQAADGWTVVNNAFPAPLWDADSGFYRTVDGRKIPDEKLNNLKIEATFHSSPSKVRVPKEPCKRAYDTEKRPTDMFTLARTGVARACPCVRFCGEQLLRRGGMDRVPRLVFQP